MREIYFATLVRLLFPLIIFANPFWGVVGSSLLDSLDVYLNDFPGIESFAHYQYWDKILDTYYLTLAFIVSLSWKDRLARNLSLFWYTLRTIGVLLFAATGERYWLFFFPNFFECYFLFYLGWRYLFKKNPLRSKYFLGIFLLIAGLKIAQEYVLHFARLEFWKWIK